MEVGEPWLVEWHGYLYFDAGSVLKKRFVDSNCPRRIGNHMLTTVLNHQRPSFQSELQPEVRGLFST